MAQSKVEKSSTTRNKTGGRKKGTPNKDTEYIQNLLEKKNFCPIELMIMVAQNDWAGLGYSEPEFEKQGFQGVTFYEPVISMDHRITAAKTLISYLYPKRKAIEHSVADDAKGSFTFSYNTKPMNQDSKND